MNLSSYHIDLGGFLGLNPNLKPGYDEISYTVHIKEMGHRSSSTEG